MRRIILAASAAALFLVPAGSAGAGPDVHDMTGDWAGFFQSGMDNPDLRGPVDMKVLDQSHRRYTAWMSFPDGTACLLDGTIAESGHTSAVGDCGPGTKITLQGAVQDMNDFGTIIPCTFEGRWMLTTPLGRDEGQVALLHFADGPVELATGHWVGTAWDKGDPNPKMLSADLTSDRTMKRGTGMVDAGGARFQVIYDMNGDGDGFTLVGAGDAGLLVMTAAFSPGGAGSPAMIWGRHAVHLMDGGLLEGTFMLEREPAGTP